MTFNPAELRAFPRMACGRDVRLHIAQLFELGQVIDISAAGCKILPTEVIRLATHRPPTGTEILVDFSSTDVVGRLVWATPNYSAIGCAFDEPLSPGLLMQLAQAVKAA